MKGVKPKTDSQTSVCTPRCHTELGSALTFLISVKHWH